MTSLSILRFESWIQLHVTAPGTPFADGAPICAVGRVTSAGESAALWRQAHAVLHEDQPYTFLTNRKAVVYIDKRIKNVKITNMGRSYAWEFYVPASMQLHTDR